MNWFNRILLNHITKSEIRRRNQFDAITDIFYELNLCLKAHITLHRSTNFNPFHDTDDTVEAFIARCANNSELRSKYETKDNVDAV
jgi:hypothetical protein